MIQVIIFLICGALVFPFFFVYPFTYYKTVQYLFTLPSLSALSLAFAFLSSSRIRQAVKEGKLYIILSLLFLIFPLIHVFLFRTITLSEFFYSIIWITIPFFAFLYNEELKKALPLYFFVFLLFDILNSALQQTEIVGIAGNRNWHAASLAIFIPFSLYFAKGIYSKLSNKIGKTASKTIIFVVFSVTTAISIYLIIICRTRMILVLFPLLLLVAIFLEIREKHKKLVIILLIMVLVALGGLFTVSRYYKNAAAKPTGIATIQKDEKILQTKLASTLDRDVRGPLWQGCIELISKHPYIGVSAPRFESEYQLYRPIEYFTKPDNAVRSNHPHNSILYMSASYGIPGMLVWLIIWILPMIICLIRYYKLSTISKIVLFSYILLFIHGLMDLIFFEWPTVFFSALLIGILWGDLLKGQTPPPKEASSGKKNNKKVQSPAIKPFPKYIDYLCKVSAFVLLMLTLRIVYLDTMSSYYNRLGEYSEVDGYKKQAVSYYEKGAAYKKDPQYVYRGATTCIQDLNDPKKALYFLDMFKDMSTSNYAHSNGFIALALVKEGRLKEALPYLLKEVVIFPLQVGSWYRLAYVQGTLGLKQDAEISFNNMMETLKYKNLPPNKRTIYFLLDNPVYDAHPDRIPPDDIKKLNAP